MIYHNSRTEVNTFVYNGANPDSILNLEKVRNLKKGVTRICATSHDLTFRYSEGTLICWPQHIRIIAIEKSEAFLVGGGYRGSAPWMSKVYCFYGFLCWATLWTDSWVRPWIRFWPQAGKRNRFLLNSEIQNFPLTFLLYMYLF